MAKPAQKNDVKLTKRTNKLNQLKPKIINIELKNDNCSNKILPAVKCGKKGSLKPSATQAAKETIQTLKQCAEESRKIFNKYQKEIQTISLDPFPGYKDTKYIGLNSFNVNLDSTETRLDSIKIRERYKQEIDNLRKRLMEMRSHKYKPSFQLSVSTIYEARNAAEEALNKSTSELTHPAQNPYINSKKSTLTTITSTTTTTTNKEPAEKKSFINFQEYKKISKNIKQQENSNNPTSFEFEDNENQAKKEKRKSKMTSNNKKSKSDVKSQKSSTTTTPANKVEKRKIILQTDKTKSIFEQPSSTNLPVVVKKPETSTKNSTFNLIGKINVEAEIQNSTSNCSVKDVEDVTPSEQQSNNNNADVLSKKLSVIEEKNECVVEKERKNSLACGDFPVSNNSCWPIRESLFPHMPPYWRFSEYDEIGPVRIPYKAKKIMKWKSTNITPNVVRKVLHLSGFQLSRTTDDWLGQWGKHMKSTFYKELSEMQKLNHFPGTYQLGRKDRLWKNIHTMALKYGDINFGFMPYTYIVPEEIELLENDWNRKIESGGDGKWIVKPPASARGIGIKVINKFEDVPAKQSRIVQLYISKPYLINGNKFDIRLYVLVTSFCPLRIYLWPEGLARFASSKYTEEDTELDNKFIHLTNYSINKNSSEYTKNDDVNACQGHKWTLTSLWDYLKCRGINTEELWTTLKDIIIKAFVSSEAYITPLCEGCTNTRYNCYELFGIDILLDCYLKPWLIEFNISPSLHGASPLDIHVKAPLVKAVFDLAKFHVPHGCTTWKTDPATFDSRIYTKQLTHQEKSKHCYYENVNNRKDYIGLILNDLTGDDVRHLIEAEDELEAKGQFERIFPTERTHLYLNYMEPRYYNRLFDAWEQRYGDQRVCGISYLQQLCSNKVHLRVQETKTITPKEDDDNVSESLKMIFNLKPIT